MEEASTPVKVYVRIRPPSDTTGLCSVKVIDNDQIQLGLERMFTFDHVFGPISSQVEVYSIAVYPLVSKFFNGINCTIFAYGQTGSGKTYTIGSGCSLGEQNEGIIARTVIDIFKNIEDSRNFNHLVTVSYLEIYKEELRDLLQDNLYCNKDIVIREDDDKRTIITGIVEEEVGSVEDAIGWLECGNAARVTSATEMNAHSSRSHAVFTITLVQENTASTSIDQTLNSRLISKFHFVDLAGSERVSRTNNVGERFKESIHINSGLLALGNVISALSDKRRKSTHIPYRDSKITRILKDSLGGSALTVMITCLSPSSLDLPESLNALKYAKRACRIKNHPVVNRDSDRKTTLLLTMREEVKSLRDELHKARETGLQSVGTMDSCAMMEFCDHDYLSSFIKKLLNRQQIIMDEAETAYQYCNTDISIESECQTNIRDVIKKLYYCIKANVLVNELENIETESKGTNTSCNNGIQQCDQCNNIQELKDELLFYKDILTTTDEKCSNYTMENETLQTKYNNCMKEVTGLRNEIEELTCAIKILQNELDTLKDGQQQSSDQNTINKSV